MGGEVTAHCAVIPGRAERCEPGIHQAAERADKWIPGSSLCDAPE